MNPDLKDLRVAVVPSETGNNINQQSTYEEIVACEETTYYSVPDYFKAQNDEELPLMHWSFLLDYNKKVDITGCNTDGIDYNQKQIHIGEIVRILNEWGQTTATELELDCSPCLRSIGNEAMNVVELVEEFRPSGVATLTYHDQIELGYSEYQYDDLPEDIIEEIYRIMEDYEADQLRTEKRCQD